MIAAILNSTMLDSDTAILDSDTLLSSLRFTQKHSHSTLTLTQTNSFSPNLKKAAILNPDILNLAILDSAILVFSFKLTHTCQVWFPPFVQKKSSLTLPSPLAKKRPHLFILTQLDDASHLEFHPLEFGHLGLSHHSMYSEIHSNLSRLVPTICTKKLHSFNMIQLDDGSHLEFYHVGFRHCHLGFRHLVIFSQIHSKTLSLHSDADSN